MWGEGGWGMEEGVCEGSGEEENGWLEGRALQRVDQREEVAQRGGEQAGDVGLQGEQAGEGQLGEGTCGRERGKRRRKREGQEEIRQRLQVERRQREGLHLDEDGGGRRKKQRLQPKSKVAGARGG